jgi:hypothetical protein
MMTSYTNHNFAALFKTYRLRSEILTLSEFGDLMAEEGAIYENSLFTRWQKGDRVPRERRTILKVILIFAKKGGLNSVKEANLFMAATGQRDLVKDEADLLRPYLQPTKHKFTCSSLSTNKLNHTIREVPEISLYQALIKSSKILWKSNFTYFILILFMLQTMWFLRIRYTRMAVNTEEILWSLTYGSIALFAFLFVRIKRNVSIGKNSKYITAGKLIGYGLLSQFLGLVVWVAYNSKGVKIPYPSLADIGYFGIIPFYILASIRLLVSDEASFSMLTSKKTTIFFIIPILSLICLYSIFLNSSGINYTHQLKSLLDFIYPAGEIVPILITIYAFLNSKYKIHSSIRLQYLFLIFAFTVQYLTEYYFIYLVQNNLYINGDYSDFMYATSYLVMSLCLASLMNPINYAYASVYPLARSNSKLIVDSKFIDTESYFTHTN